jgi:hypothetical protein
METVEVDRFAADRGFAAPVCLPIRLSIPLAGADSTHTLAERGIRSRTMSRLLRMRAALGFELIGPERFNKDT